MACHVFWADQLNTEVSPECVVHVESDGHMLNTFQVRLLEVVLCYAEVDAETFLALGNRLLYLLHRRKEPILGLHEIPVLGHLDKCPGVNRPIPVVVTELLADSGGLPLRPPVADCIIWRHG